MELKLLLSLALVAGLFFGGLWLLKSGVRWLAGVSIKMQYATLTGVAMVLGLVGPGTFLTGFTVSIIALFSFWTWTGMKHGLFKNRSNGETVVRGGQRVDVREVQALLKNEESNISIGQVAIPKRFESTNFLLAGAPGTGKSQTFHQILGPVRAVGERAIVADVGGEFVARYHREGDVILNPFDARSVSWSPLAEMQGEWDAERIAKSICPDGEGSAAEWNGYAQTLLSAALGKLWATDGNNGELMRLLTQASHSELKEFIDGTPAVGLFAEGNERMLGSILGIVSSKVKCYQYLDPAAGIDAFSVRKFVANDGAAWLFLSFTDPQFTSLKPIIATVLDVAASAVMELKPSSTRRVWFALDEFATLGYIGALSDLLAKGRKYGAAVILGVQSVSQIFSPYGRELTKTLLNCLGTQLILRSPDPETAEYFSSIFGEQDIQRVNHSTSSNGSDVSHSQSVQYATQRVVMPAEIQGLQNLVGYLNVVGDCPPCVVNIPIVYGEEVAERFVQKPRKAKSEAAEPITA